MAKRGNERVRKELLEAAREPVNDKARKELREAVERLEKVAISAHSSSREVYSSDGSSRVVHSVDASSPSFGQDLEHIFRLNVARARRDNKRIVGVAHHAPRKR